MKSSMNIFFLLLLCSCTSMQAVDQEQSLEDLLEPGDHLIIYSSDGRIIDMRYVLIDNMVLKGSLIDDGLTVVEIRLDEIEHIESEQLEVGKTALAITGGTVGAIVLLPFAAIGLGAAMIEGM